MSRGFGNAHEFGPGDRFGQARRGSFEEREGVGAEEDRDRHRDGEHLGGRLREVPRDRRVVDHRLGDCQQAVEHRTVPDLLDDRRWEADAFELERGHGVGALAVVDHLLEPVGEVGCGVVLAEAKRRFREEEVVDRYAPRRGEQCEDRAR